MAPAVRHATLTYLDGAATLAQIQRERSRAVTMLSGDRSIGEPIFYIVDKLVDELLITCH